MSQLEAMLLDFVRVAEAPLYTAYRRLGRRLGRDPSLEGFLDMVDSLIERDMLRLWSVDYRSHDRTELFEVPGNLATRYRAAGSLRADFDPFGLSLTLGPNAPKEAEPAWEVECDFTRNIFKLKSTPESQKQALVELNRFFPDFRFVIEHQISLPNKVCLVGSMVSD